MEVYVASEVLCCMNLSESCWDLDAHIAEQQYVVSIYPGEP